MDAVVHCRSCHGQLRVPANASGHRVRCPRCGAQFLVPRVEHLIEELCSHWIEYDVDQFMEYRHRLIEQKLAPSVQRALRRRARAAARARRGGGADAGDAAEPEALRELGAGASETHGRNEGVSPADDRRIEPEAAAPGPVEPAPPPPAAPDEVPPSPSADPAPASPDAAELPPSPLTDRLDADADSSGGPAPDARGLGAPDPDDDPLGPADAPDPAAPKEPAAPAPPGPNKPRFPVHVEVNQPRPHLVVRKVDDAGVHFGFDAAWLEQPGFRASMPMACVFCGETDPRLLIARPLVFLDQSYDPDPSIEQLTRSHELTELTHLRPRGALEAMGELQHMPRPFHHPVPYYVTARYAHLYLHCETRQRTGDRGKDRIACRVVIPETATALAWLMRVNGVCGADYHALEQEVSMMHGPAWQALDATARDRLEAWAKLRPRESFLLYLPDADQIGSDAGRNGLVLTDQRLLYSKYHHRGRARRDAEDAAVIVKPEGAFANLTLVCGQSCTKMVKLRREDIDLLAAELNKAGDKLKLIVKR